jgi:CspA family cold shock protein
VRTVPTGKVKWYDAEKGFGFVTQDGGEDVYVRASALPQGVAALKSGQRVEFGVAEGRRGPQALSVRLLEPPPSVVEARRRPAEELHGLIEDMIKLLEAKVQPRLRSGRYPDRRDAKRIAEVVHAVARELDPG